MTLSAIELPAFNRLGNLSADEIVLYAQLRRQLRAYRPINARQLAYYEGSQRVRQLEIAVPPNLHDLQTVCGWPGTGIDVLNELLYWDGWNSTGGDLLGLDEVYAANDLNVEADRAQIESLVCGVGLVSVGTGDPDRGEPEILVTAESPSDCTVLWDTRSRRVVAALSQTVNERGSVVMETLYVLGSTITLERDAGGRMVVVERDDHGKPKIPVTPLFNRSRASRSGGRSELTRAVRYYTDAAVRTLLGMEINREFYTTPQRWLMGADMSMFTDEDGRQISQFEAVMGKMLAAPRPLDEETGEFGDIPTVGQFTPAPPTPYIEQVRHYSMMFAAEVGFPASYLGYATDNPASADAIRAGQTRLTNRSKRRQMGLTWGWRDVAYNILLWRDGAVDPAKFSPIAPNWVDPTISTPQAVADEVTKLVAAEVLLPDSPVTYDRLGLTQRQQAQLDSDKRRARGAKLATGLAAAAQAARQDSSVAQPTRGPANGL